MGGAVGEAAGRGRRGFAKDEELDESADQEDDGELAQEEALSE